MKKADVVIGGTYWAKVSNEVVKIKITGENKYGGWDAVNLKTDRAVRVRSAARLRGVVKTKPKMPVSVEVAMEVLNIKKGEVHSFIPVAMALMGCNVPVDDVIERAKKLGGFLVAGPNQMALGHGIALFDKDAPEFFETKPDTREMLETLGKAFAQPKPVTAKS